MTTAEEAPRTPVRNAERVADMESEDATMAKSGGALLSPVKPDRKPALRPRQSVGTGRSGVGLRSPSKPCGSGADPKLSGAQQSELLDDNPVVNQEARLRHLKAMREAATQVTVKRIQDFCSLLRCGAPSDAHYFELEHAMNILVAVVALTDQQQTEDMLQAEAAAEPQAAAAAHKGKTGSSGDGQTRLRDSPSSRRPPTFASRLKACEALANPATLKNCLRSFPSTVDAARLPEWRLRSARKVVATRIINITKLPPAAFWMRRWLLAAVSYVDFRGSFPCKVAARSIPETAAQGSEATEDAADVPSEEMEDVSAEQADGKTLYDSLDEAHQLHTDTEGDGSAPVAADDDGVCTASTGESVCTSPPRMDVLDAEDGSGLECSSSDSVDDTTTAAAGQGLARGCSMESLLSDWLGNELAAGSSSLADDGCDAGDKLLLGTEEPYGEHEPLGMEGTSAGTVQEDDSGKAAADNDADKEDTAHATALTAAATSMATPSVAEPPTDVQYDKETNPDKEDLCAAECYLPNPDVCATAVMDPDPILKRECSEQSLLSDWRGEELSNTGSCTQPQDAPCRDQNGGQLHVEATNVNCLQDHQEGGWYDRLPTSSAHLGEALGSSADILPGLEEAAAKEETAHWEKRDGEAKEVDEEVTREGSEEMEEDDQAGEQHAKRQQDEEEEEEMQGGQEEEQEEGSEEHAKEQKEEEKDENEGSQEEDEREDSEQIDENEEGKDENDEREEQEEENLTGSEEVKKETEELSAQENTEEKEEEREEETNDEKSTEEDTESGHSVEEQKKQEIDEHVSNRDEEMKADSGATEMEAEEDPNEEIETQNRDERRIKRDEEHSHALDEMMKEEVPGHDEEHSHALDEMMKEEVTGHDEEHSHAVDEMMKEEVTGDDEEHAHSFDEMMKEEVTGYACKESEKEQEDRGPAQEVAEDEGEEGIEEKTGVMETKEDRQEKEREEEPKDVICEERAKAKEEVEDEEGEEDKEEQKKEETKECEKEGVRGGSEHQEEEGKKREEQEEEEDKEEERIEDSFDMPPEDRQRGATGEVEPLELLAGTEGTAIRCPTREEAALVNQAAGLAWLAGVHGSHEDCSMVSPYLDPLQPSTMQVQPSEGTSSIDPVSISISVSVPAEARGGPTSRAPSSSWRVISMSQDIVQLKKEGALLLHNLFLMIGIPLAALLAMSEVAWLIGPEPRPFV